MARPTLPKLLRAPARAAGLAGWTAFMLSAAEAHKALAHRLSGADREQQAQIFEGYMRTWTAVILEVLAVELRQIGDKISPATGPRLVVCNHRSAVDIPILLTHFGGSVLSRGDLEHWPLLGLAAQKAQTIFVDRESRHSGAAAIRAIREQLARGRTISVFPEGTTFAGDEVRPFNAGAFAACRGLDVEYLPVGLAYPPGCEFVEDSFVAHAQAVGARPGTPVVMNVGAPLRFSGREGKAARVAEQLHDAVQELVTQARAVALAGR